MTFNLDIYTFNVEYVIFSLLLTGDHKRYAFLLETNNKSSLTVRQGCAVESCVRFSGRSCLLLMLSNSLNICDKKVSLQRLCSLFKLNIIQVRRLFEVPGALVFHLNVSLLTVDTPLESMFIDGRVNASCCKTIHYSDILRLAVLFRLVRWQTKGFTLNSCFRYGGWYTDTDTVTIRETTEVKTNTVALSDVYVTNANLFFQKQYEFLRLLMIEADRRYTGIGKEFF